MQRTQSSGDRETAAHGRAMRQTRRRNAVWLVPNTTQSFSSRRDSQDPQIVGALALDKEAAFAPDARAAQAPVCILIVEDNSHIANQLSNELNLGPNADWANSIAKDNYKALSHSPQMTPTIALIDTAQLGLGGIAVYHRLQAHPLAQESVIIFITSSTALELSARGVEDGILLRTPFRTAHAIALITALVSAR